MTTEQTPTAAMPLFYRSPEPLLTAEHGRAGLVSPGHAYGFAQSTNAVPIQLAEFALAARQYPIVFGGGADPVPVVVLGSARQSNLHVDEDGEWREGYYVPAYVRRYPFIPITGGQGGMSLGIDTACDRYVADCSDDNEAMRLFDDDGKAAPFVREAMRLCAEYNDAHAVTAGFCEALHEAGLLAPATLQMVDGRRMRGFRAVDAKALAALDDATVLDWWRKGWMDAIALHRASQQNWSTLVRLGAETVAGGESGAEAEAQAGEEAA